MLLSLFLSAGISAGCILAGKLLLHYFQLESYQFPGYFRTVRRNLFKSLLPGFLMMLLLFLCILLVALVLPGPEVPWFVYFAVVVVLAAGGYAVGRFCSEKKAKKAFVFTARMKRLYLISFILFTLILWFVSLRMSATGSTFSFSSVFVILFPLFLPLWIALSGFLAWPVEKAISELYFRDAQHILRGRDDLIRIGITGSWGKTSVKFILGRMLEEKYHTLVTPASYNTPMGVTKIIRSRIEPGHRVFVAEMGARHVGDIREMCRLVHPTMGILTSVGPQHLDTFRTVERVAQTKYELIEGLPDDGCAFFADDNGICFGLYQKTGKEKYLSGLNGERDDVWAENIQTNEKGSSFELCTKELRIPCQTALLGELNIRNILLCACVCLKLGLNAEQISRGISKLKPVEHRLQLIENSGGITVIDDAFNSNILGAQQAFKVLKLMPGKRILVTPGMVELGNRETELNREFGRAASDCCDTVILVGKKRSGAIVEGLEEGGFNRSDIYVTANLDEAAELLKTIAKNGDTVLFENDLPDNYSE